MRGIIATGDLSQRVEVEFRDETGELGHTFNLMTADLQKAYDAIKGYALKAVVAQKREQKVRNIFQKYVPREVIDRFFTAPESMLVGEDRVLAVLFSDIRSFTSISEQMPPAVLVESLNRYFGLMVDIISGRGGVVDKYIGDAIMAFYGAPVHHDDDALQAVRSGLEMLDSLEGFNSYQREHGLPEFKIGIGIAYGTVTVGNIGSEKKMDYTVIGDMVNVASRLEGLTKQYGQPLIVSDSAWEAVKDHLPCRLLDQVAVKGRTHGLGIYAPRLEVSSDLKVAWEKHDAGRRLYLSRDFGAARAAFLEVQRLLPGDQVAEIYAERCAHFQVEPPPKGWTGLAVMTEK